MSERPILSVAGPSQAAAKAKIESHTAAPISGAANIQNQQKAVTFAAKPGDILICDFGPDPSDPGTYPVAAGPVSVPSEIIKERRVVVISTPTPQTCIVAPFSSQTPDPQKAYHIEIPLGSYPFFNKVSWLKADMLIAVSRQRLDRPFFDGRYQRSVLSKADFKRVREAVLNALGLGTLSQYLT